MNLPAQFRGRIAALITNRDFSTIRREYHPLYSLGYTMPERNLVTLRLRNYFVLTLVALTVVTMQLGCSKLRNGPLGRDFLTKQDDSISQYMLDPDQDFNQRQTPSDMASPNFGKSELANQVANQTAERTKPTARSAAEVTPAQSGLQVPNQTNIDDVEDGNTFPNNPIRSSRSSSGAFALTPAPSLRDVEDLDPASLAGRVKPQLKNQADKLSGILAGVSARNQPQQETEEEACEHDAQCDCHKQKTKPRLPYAEQIEPPTYEAQTLSPVKALSTSGLEATPNFTPTPNFASTGPAIAAAPAPSFESTPVRNANEYLIQMDEVEKPAITSMVPPSALVSQPLSPILFDADTRAVQIEDVSNKRSSNSLRRNEEWSHEKSVAVTNRLAPAPSMASRDQTKAEPGPVKFQPALDMRDEHVRLASTNFAQVTFEVCQTCRLADCDGSCSNRMRRASHVQATPVVNSDPIIIVATTSEDTIPPFAEPPANEISANEMPASDFASPLSVSETAESSQFQANEFQPAELQPMESSQAESLVATEPLAVPAEEDEWLALFGPIPETTGYDPGTPSEPCPGCHSKACVQGCENVESFAGDGDFAPSSSEQITSAAANEWLGSFDTSDFQPAEVNPAIQSARSSWQTPATLEPTSTPVFVEHEEVVNEAATLELPTIQIPKIQIPNVDVHEELPSLEIPNFAPENFSPAETKTPQSKTERNQLGQSEALDEPMTVAPVAYEAPAQMTALSRVNPSTTYAPAPSMNRETAEHFPLTEMESDPIAEAVSAIDEREPEVRIEVVDTTVPWTVKLEETIENVKDQLSKEVDANAKNGLEVNLRLLEVLERQMQDIDQREQQNMLTNGEKQYWQHQLDAITSMLDASQTTQTAARNLAAEDTLGHLRKAVERLESLANLSVSNGAFCTEISGFGQFKSFPTTNFRARQKMLIYCEVENYLSEEKVVNESPQVHTRLRGSLAIYNAQGKSVQRAEFPVVDDIARKRRRDFYMYFPVQLGDLPAGQYKLVLMVEDLNGNKSSTMQPAMAFTVQ